MNKYLARTHTFDPEADAYFPMFMEFDADDAQHAREQADDACSTDVLTECVAVYELVWADTFEDPNDEQGNEDVT